MKYKSLKNQIEEKNGLRFWVGDVIIIKTSSIPMVSSSISIVYKNSFFNANDEHLSFPNNSGVWNFLKKISEDRVSIKVEVLDKDENISLVEFENSTPYKHRFNRARI